MIKLGTILTLMWITPAVGELHPKPLGLVQNGAFNEANATHERWWDDRTAGNIAGVWAMFCCPAIVAISWLCIRGKAKRIAMGLLVLLLTVGIVSMGVAVVAVTRSQPYAVYYPCLLTGLISTIIATCGYPELRDRFAAIELRQKWAKHVT